MDTKEQVLVQLSDEQITMLEGYIARFGVGFVWTVVGTYGQTTERYVLDPRKVSSVMMEGGEVGYKYARESGENVVLHPSTVFEFQRRLV